MVLFHMLDVVKPLRGNNGRVVVYLVSAGDLEESSRCLQLQSSLYSAPLCVLRVLFDESISCLRSFLTTVEAANLILIR